MLGLIFVLSGFQKLMGFSGVAEGIAGKGLPMPDSAVASAVTAADRQAYDALG